MYVCARVATNVVVVVSDTLVVSSFARSFRSHVVPSFLRSSVMAAAGGGSPSSSSSSPSSSSSSPSSSSSSSSSSRPKRARPDDHCDEEPVVAVSLPLSVAKEVVSCLVGKLSSKPDILPAILALPVDAMNESVLKEFAKIIGGMDFVSPNMSAFVQKMFLQFDLSLRNPDDIEDNNSLYFLETVLSEKNFVEKYLKLTGGFCCTVSQYLNGAFSRKTTRVDRLLYVLETVPFDPSVDFNILNELVLALNVRMERGSDAVLDISSCVIRCLDKLWSLATSEHFSNASEREWFWLKTLIRWINNDDALGLEKVVVQIRKRIASHHSWAPVGGRGLILRRSSDLIVPWAIKLLTDDDIDVDDLEDTTRELLRILRDLFRSVYFLDIDNHDHAVQTVPVLMRIALDYSGHGFIDEGLQSEALQGLGCLAMTDAGRRVIHEHPKFDELVFRCVTRIQHEEADCVRVAMSWFAVKGGNEEVRTRLRKNKDLIEALRDDALCRDSYESLRELAVNLAED